MLEGSKSTVTNWKSMRFQINLDITVSSSSGTTLQATPAASAATKPAESTDRWLTRAVLLTKLGTMLSNWFK